MDEVRMTAVINEQIVVRGAPQEYICQTGCLQELSSHLEARNMKTVLIVHGEHSFKAAEAYWPADIEAQCLYEPYNGECSPAEIGRITKLALQQQADAIIGIGGGKVLDLAKSSGHKAGKPVILIPTLASNCAAWTPISVIYGDSGEFIRFEALPAAASLVLIEPNLLLQSPVEYFIAGIGDTLAKWYEANVQLEAIRDKPLALECSYFAARLCRDILLRHSEQAVTDMLAGRLTEEWLKAAETIIMAGGMVGGFGDKYGRIVGAHSIHNGLTVLEETHHLLHGSKVAYGVLVQLYLEGKLEQIEELLPFYRSIHLPYSLKMLGLSHVQDNRLALVAEMAAAPAETIHLMPREITACTIASAMDDLERFIEKCEYGTA